MACEARQEGDEMACACGLRWSVADVEPPQCRRVRHVVPVLPARRELLVGARQECLTSPRAGNLFIGVAVVAPVALDLVLADRMARASVNAGGSVAGMRAAYRIFLDSLP